MERSPLFLAALASAAVPGLDPASVEALPGAPEHAEHANRYDVAFVQDTQHRRWVVRVPRSQVASAQMESTFALLTLLARRLPFSLPTPKGFAALKEGGRAAIYPYLPGQNVDFAQLPPGPGLAAELGRAIAALHNADHGLFEEAGLPAYDADTYRTRRLSELDRAAATGHVPTGLLARWEKLLEDVTLWRFAPTPTHGDLTGQQVLVVFDDDEDASTGRVRAMTGWEAAKVADPADDFFALATQAPARALDTLMEAYAHARSERPDAHLLTRARLSGEMRILSELLSAVASGDRLHVERHAATLRRLDERLHAEQEAANDYRRAGFSPARPRGPVLVPPVVDEEDGPDDDVEAMFAKTAPEQDPEGAEAAEPTQSEPTQSQPTQSEPTETDSDVAEFDDVESDPSVGTAAGVAADGMAADDVCVEDADDVTAEIDVTSLRTPAPAEPTPIGGDDPGPEYEPGYSTKP